MKSLILKAFLILTASFFFEASKTFAQTPTKVEYRGQKQSSFTWGNTPEKSFLSFKSWKEESDIRDKVPDWEKIIRERDHREMVGRVYQCKGACRVDRGESFFNSSYRSALYEGDEVQTVADSYAWIFLFDGTMVRLSPQSSITFNELNIGIKENFINARINAGNVLWLSRQEALFEERNLRETDVLFFPYSEYKSIPVTDKKPYIEDDLFELLAPANTYVNQYKALNEKILENNKRTKNKPTYAYLVMPNVTLMGMSPSVEMVVLLGGKSYFKRRSPELLGHQKNEDNDFDMQFQLRGFENKTLNSLQEDLWLSVDEKGRNYSEAEDTNWLGMGEFMTKRIPSIMLGREIFLNRYSEFAFREKYDPLKLASIDGYRLWGKLKSEEGEKKADLEERLDFLKEYFRRIETSNLLASSRFKERLAERGETVAATEYGNYFFIKALNIYYKYGEALSKKSDDKETGEVLNSTTKTLWKKMHGIR